MSSLPTLDPSVFHYIPLLGFLSCSSTVSEDPFGSMVLLTSGERTVLSLGSLAIGCKKALCSATVSEDPFGSMVVLAASEGTVLSLGLLSTGCKEAIVLSFIAGSVVCIC